MDPKDLASTFRLILYQFRSGKREQAYASAMVLLFCLGVALGSAPKSLSGIDLSRPAGYGEIAFYAGSAVFLVLLVHRIWVESIAIREPPPPPPSDAVIGLLPFTEVNGQFFARLGRTNELGRLLAVARNDRAGLCAVRGRSGAGKTSLLRAGLAFSLGAEHCIYWEATLIAAAEDLLHAVQARFPQIESLDRWVEDPPGDCVVILDQFEQLSENLPAHAPIFDLLARIAKAPAPHSLRAIVGFRREYLPDWGDFEDRRGFQAEHVAINLLAPATSSEILTILAGEAGITLDNALVNNFISAVTQPEGVSPVDIAIGVLSLVNFARGAGHVANADYATAGGAEGLLLSFVQERLEEIPPTVRTPLLKGLVLTLVDPSNDRRIAQGATAAEIGAKAEAPEALLLPSLKRWTHPTIRLLERPNETHYRLPHERLVPVLRRLAGLVLAEQDRVRILFESEFARWCETKSKRYLLSGKDLRNAIPIRDSLVRGDSAAQRLSYLAASIRRRGRNRMVSAAAVLAIAAVGYLVAQWADAWIQRDRLYRWGLSPALFDLQDEADSIEVPNFKSVNDLAWLHSRRVKSLSLQFRGSGLTPLSQLSGLNSLTLYHLGNYPVNDLSVLQKLTGLNSLTMDFCGPEGPVGLEKLTGLTSLTLDLRCSPPVERLTGLEKLTGLNSLTLYLMGSRVKDLSFLENLTGLSSLTLDLRALGVIEPSGFEKLTRLKSLTLKLNGRQVRNLFFLDKLTSLTSLTFDLGGAENLGIPRFNDLSGLDKLTGLESLTLNLNNSEVKDLSGLDKLTRLTSLRLGLNGSQVKDLSGLDKLTGLTSLTLNLNNSGVKDLSGLDKLTGLTSLTLYLNNSWVKDLSCLDKLTGLTSLTLYSNDPQVSGLSGLDKLTGLTSLTLYLNNSGVKDLSGLDKLTGLASLTLDLGSSRVPDLTSLDKLTHLKSLKLGLAFSDDKNLSGLDKLTGLRCLELDLEHSQVWDLPSLDRLTGLDKLTGLTSLTLHLNSSQIKDLSGLDKLTGLESLDLDVSDTRVTSLSELQELVRLQDLRVFLPLSVLPTFPKDERLRRVTALSVEMTKEGSSRALHGFKSISLVD